MGRNSNIENSSGSRDQNIMEKSEIQTTCVKTPSFKTLIKWNISKALKHNPGIDLKAALREAQERLEEPLDVKNLMSAHTHNLSCALLAWQQLGHHGTDSLFNYFQQSLKEENCELKQNEGSLCASGSYGSNNLNMTGSIKSSHMWGTPTKMDFSTSIGLVVKLPAEPTLMHFSGPVRVPITTKKCCSRDVPKSSSDIKRNDTSASVDKPCMERLKKIESETAGLRQRVTQFARRAKQRSVLLERAEMGWRDLESSYQRRLRQAREKEEEYQKKTSTILNERNRYKEACFKLADVLKTKSMAVEKDQEILKKLEQEVYSLACERARLAERVAQADAQLTDNQCRAAQVDRNLALKEEQERRRQAALERELESAKMLVFEAEFAQRTELQAQRDQVAQVSRDLLEEDTRNELLKRRIEEYMKEKDEIIEDLDACQKMCDTRMEALIKDWKTKKEKLEELQETVLECMCKEPVDRAVEVKRTPSIAAVCNCTPDDMDSCSCTSIRSRLLSSLLRDLFGGLKSEMETTSPQMPCQLLKCLEDKHNWDRTTDIKTNIRAYFSRLLLGELDMAIATVIEKSHAQWVGECCADRRKRELSQTSRHSLLWQEHDLEMKTQKLAKQLADKMFKEKANELALQAQEELAKSGHPPCECDRDAQYASAVYSCLVDPYRDYKKMKNAQLNVVPDKLHRKDNHIKPLTQTKLLKKDVKRSLTTLLNKSKKHMNSIRPEQKICSTACKKPTTRRISNVTARNLKSVTNKAETDLKTDTKKNNINGLNKVFKGAHQYAVNMCLNNNENRSPFQNSHKKNHMESELSHIYKSCVLCVGQQNSNVSDRKILTRNSFQDNVKAGYNLCTEKCACLNSTPSNTSLDRLISILNKCRDNLGLSQEGIIKEALNADSLFNVTHESIVNTLQELSKPTGETKSNNSATQLEKGAIIVKNNNLSQNKEKEIDKEKEASKNFGRQLQVKKSKLLVPFNDVLYKCNNDVQNGTPNANSQHNIPSADSMSVLEDVQLVSTENYLLVKSKTAHDEYPKIDTSIKYDNSEMDLMEEKLIKNVIDYSTAHIQVGEKCIQCLGATLTNPTCKPALTKTTKQSHQINDKSPYREQKRDHKEIVANCNILNNQSGFNEKYNVAKYPTKSNNNCESCVQFLGVTLEKVNANVLTKHTSYERVFKSKSNKQNQNHLFDVKRKNNNVKSDDKMFILNTTEELREPKCAVQRIKALNIVHVHNECINPNRNIENLNNNKSIEVKINSYDILKDEPCICCPISKEDRSNDLEVNAFQILEDHLRSKVDQIRHSTCASFCIQNLDEKSFLDDTLLKVKKLILESANTMACKCEANNHTSDGSWKRAHGLLQEYLKTKIDQVQCLCNSVEYSQDNNLVSRVLSQINCLIEDDLHRLKNICKCNNTSLYSTTYESRNSHELRCIIGEAKKCDNIVIRKAYEQNCMPSSKIVESKFVNYTDRVLLSHNKSAQALLCQSVDTKSCDALKTYNEDSEVQPLDTIKAKIYLDNNNNTENDNYRSPINNDVQNVSTKKIEDVKGLPQVTSPSDNNLENECNEMLSLVDDQFDDETKAVGYVNGEKKKEKLFAQYIGYTFNCCCDQNLGCVCIKSKFPSNTEWLETNVIWQNYIQKQGVLKDVSYILNKTPNQPSNNADPVKNTTEIIQTHNGSESDICPNVEHNSDLEWNKLKVHLNDNCYNNDFVDDIKTKLLQSEVNASEDKHNIHLQKSDRRLDIVRRSSISLTNDCLIHEISVLPKIKQQGIIKRQTHDLLNNDSMCLSDTALVTDDEPLRSNSLCTNCDCEMVPICHVKMLVDNIGNKLVKAECTCDWLKSVCPIHS